MTGCVRLKRPCRGQKARAVSRQRTCRRLWLWLDPFNSFTGLGPGAMVRNYGCDAPFPLVIRVEYAWTRSRASWASEVEPCDTKSFVTVSQVSDSTNPPCTIHPFLSRGFPSRRFKATETFRDISPTAKFVGMFRRESCTWLACTVESGKGERSVKSMPST